MCEKQALEMTVHVTSLVIPLRHRAWWEVELLELSTWTAQRIATVPRGRVMAQREGGISYSVLLCSEELSTT